MDKEFKLSKNQMYQRKAKYRKLRENFEALDIRFLPERDVFHVYEFDNIIYACWGSKNLTRIIEEINKQRLVLNY